jgi:hypothetical protein
VLEQSCGSTRKGSDEIEAWRYLGATKQIYVHVICAPYGAVAGLPALKIADCDNTKGRWNCDHILPALRIGLPAGEVVLAYSAHIAPESAVEIATYASTVRSFNGRAVPAFPVGVCAISDGQSVPFEGAINFELACDGYRARITKDCWEKRCRLFFTAFDEFMAESSSNKSLERTREG